MSAIVGIRSAGHWLSAPDSGALSGTVTMDGFGTFFTVASLHLVQYADSGTGRAQFLEFETKSGGVVNHHDLNGQFATFGADQVISVSWNIACIEAYCAAVGTLYLFG
jgi:hypothetical protein